MTAWQRRQSRHPNHHGPLPLASEAIHVGQIGFSSVYRVRIPVWNIWSHPVSGPGHPTRRERQQQTGVDCKTSDRIPVTAFSVQSTEHFNTRNNSSTVTPRRACGSRLITSAANSSPNASPSTPVAGKRIQRLLLKTRSPSSSEPQASAYHRCRMYPSSIPSFKAVTGRRGSGACSDGRSPARCASTSWQFIAHRARSASMR